MSSILKGLIDEADLEEVNLNDYSRTERFAERELGKRPPKESKVIGSIGDDYKVYHDGDLNWGDNYFYVTSPKSGRTVIFLSTIVNKNVPNVHNINVVIASKKSPGVDKLYKFLVLKKNFTLVGSDHSPGARKVWIKASRHPGINMHGYNLKTGEAFKILPSDEEAYASQKEHEKWMGDSSKIDRNNQEEFEKYKKEIGDISQTIHNPIVMHKRDRKKNTQIGEKRMSSVLKGILDETDSDNKESNMAEIYKAKAIAAQANNDMTGYYANLATYYDLRSKYYTNKNMQKEAEQCMNKAIKYHEMANQSSTIKYTGRRNQLLNKTDLENEINEAEQQRSVIVGHDATDPEIAVLGGAGVYKLSALKKKAIREAEWLMQDLRDGKFADSAYNIKQLANTLETIKVAEEEMKRKYFGEAKDSLTYIISKKPNREGYHDVVAFHGNGPFPVGYRRAQPSEIRTNMPLKVHEDSDMRFAAEKTPTVTPYGKKERQFRGAISEISDTKTNVRQTGGFITPEHDNAYLELKRIAPRLFSYIRNEAPVPLDPIMTLNFLHHMRNNEEAVLHRFKQELSKDTKIMYGSDHPSLNENIDHFWNNILNEMPDTSGPVGTQEGGWRTYKPQSADKLSVEEDTAYAGGGGQGGNAGQSYRKFKPKVSGTKIKKTSSILKGIQSESI